MEKKPYIEPVLDIIEIELEEVISSSQIIIDDTTTLPGSGRANDYRNDFTRNSDFE